MRRWLPFIVPFVLVFTLGTVFVARQRGWLSAEARGPVEFATFDDLDHPPEWVRLSGMAHYTAVVEQHVPGGLFREPETWYLFGLFPPYDTDGRMIRVLIRTKRQPEKLVSFELMTVEGRLTHPTLAQVPFDTEIILGKGTDYWFADDLWIIEPFSIETGLDDRVKPAPEEPPKP